MKKVSGEKLMCKPHWAGVPRWIKLRILETYRIGQAVGVHPSTEWVRAVKDAMFAVREGALV